MREREADLNSRLSRGFRRLEHIPISPRWSRGEQPCADRWARPGGV